MGDCGSDCGCGGGLSRRDLLRISAGVAGALAAGDGLLAEEGTIPPAARVPPGPDWFADLRTATGPIVYEGERLRHLLFPLGGIGTGTIWLDGRGRLVNWQIFNNIQKNTQVDDTFLAVRIEQEGRPSVIRALQTEPLGPIDGIAGLRFTGQYPTAVLRFHDDELPVDLELEAWNPLIPHEEKDSSLPCAIFTVRAVNRTDRPVRVSVLCSVQNAVGHAGRGASGGVHHLTYGGNVNAEIAGDGLTGVVMRAEPGHLAEVDPPLNLVTDHHLLPVIEESPAKGLHHIGVGAAPATPDVRTVYWLSGGDLKLVGGSLLKEIATAVRERGDGLLLLGRDHPLLKGVEPTLPAGIDRDEVVFAHFDGEDHGAWKRHGRAFDRPRPKRGAAYDQPPVTGFLGAGLVNSFEPSDEKRGAMTSPPFRIERRYISFLIGGGHHPNSCCINLKLDDQVVRTATGKNREQLDRVEWDVADLAGSEAVIEILDRHQKDWGHVLIDDIRFSNVPVDDVTVSEAEAWNALTADLRGAARATVGLGQVRVIEPAEVPESDDPVRRRDAWLALIAPMAGSQYRPAMGRPADAPSFGSMCVATSDRGVSRRVAWTDRAEVIGPFRRDGRLTGPDQSARPPTPAGETVNSAICVEAMAEAGGQAEATFVLAWHFPHQYYPHNAWLPVNNTAVEIGQSYANGFADAEQVAAYVCANLDRLRERTSAYRAAVFESTLPNHLIDAATASVSILRSPTCFRAKDGTFYGYEGCRPEGDGCCPLNCNHVWNYEHALAHLWPAIERDMRVTELKYHLREDGGIHHRVEVPRDNPDKRHPPVADGQCGDILKAYREHLRSPDGAFLDEFWPAIAKAMDFAVEHWDHDRDGVMEQPQHNTHDYVVYGHNTFVSSQYLAALRAAEEMARLKGDGAAAARFRELFEKGRDQIARELFNGEYYIQKADRLEFGYGDGCWSEQVLGQWWASLLGLGDVLPADQVVRALKAVFKHNWLWTQEGFAGTQRAKLFADGDDKALVNGSWPHGGRPAVPMLHRDEAWTGVEYAVAAHKLLVGQIDEALAIVKGVRERYDGRKRGPWNEIECGDYYVRAMSGWTLLLAAQGYTCDGPAGTLGFNPCLSPQNHRSFFTVPEGWGRFEQTRDGHRQTDVLTLLHGRCRLTRLSLGLPAGHGPIRTNVTLDDQVVAGSNRVVSDRVEIQFPTGVSFRAPARLSVEITIEK